MEMYVDFRVKRPLSAEDSAAHPVMVCVDSLYDMWEVKRTPDPNPNPNHVTSTIRFAMWHVGVLICVRVRTVIRDVVIS